MKIKKLKDLEPGDWYKIPNSILNKEYVIAKTETIIYFSSPEFCNDSYNQYSIKLWGDKDCFHIGTSKPNFWYNVFGWTRLPHKVKLKEFK